MGRVWLRLTIAILYVLLSTASFYVDAATPDISPGSRDVGGLAAAAALVVYVGLTILTGYIVGWPSLALPFVIYLLLLPLGVDPEDSDRWTYAALYAIPSGFFSFFVLGLGWSAGIGANAWRRRRKPAPSDTHRRESWRLLLVPLGVLAIAGVLVLVLVLNSTSTEVKTPKLSIDKRSPPREGDSVLHLSAGEVAGCMSGKDRVIDPRADESSTEVVVHASLEIQREFPCDTETAQRSFIVVLRHPLGRRRVIDGSRGAVIWPQPGGIPPRND